jgi:hypothetical protein
VSGDGNGYNRLGVAAAVFVAATTIVGGFMWVGSIASQVSAMQHNGDDIRSLQVQEARVERDARETETQFCAADIVRNLMHANDMRTISLLWLKQYGTPFPTDNAYYPTICNRPVSGQ